MNNATRTFHHDKYGRVILVAPGKAKRLIAAGVKEGTKIRVDGVEMTWWSAANPLAPKDPLAKPNRAERRAHASHHRREMRREGRAVAREEKAK